MGQYISNYEMLINTAFIIEVLITEFEARSICRRCCSLGRKPNYCCMLLAQARRCVTLQDPV